MGRRNNRIRFKSHLPAWSKEVSTVRESICTANKEVSTPKTRCAFCGRVLGVNDWHWMFDEYGQRVRKCNNEHVCYSRRSVAGNEAFIRAIKFR